MKKKKKNKKHKALKTVGFTKLDLRPDPALFKFIEEYKKDLKTAWEEAEDKEVGEEEVHNI